MRVMVRVPTRGNPSMFTIQRMEWMRSQRPEWDFGYHSNAYSIAIGRNEMCALARQGDFDYLIMLDDDVIPPSRILQLPEHNLPVVSGLTPVWQAGYHQWNAYEVVDNVSFQTIDLKGWDMGMLREVYAVGASCLCIRKDVLANEALWPLFACRVRPDGTMMFLGGEDTWFSMQCQAAGIKVMVDPQCQCEHWRPTGLKQTAKTFEDVGEAMSVFNCDVRGLEFELPGVTPPPIETAPVEEEKPKASSLDAELERAFKRQGLDSRFVPSQIVRSKC